MFRNEWVGIKAFESGPSFSHLFFAGYLVLFAKLDNHHCQLIKDVLLAFCNFSSLRITFNKSQMFVSLNISAQSAKVLSQNSGIPLTTNSGKYLGVSLIHNKSGIFSYPRKKWFRI